MSVGIAVLAVQTEKRANTFFFKQFIHARGEHRDLSTLPASWSLPYLISQDGSEVQQKYIEDHLKESLL